MVPDEPMVMINAVTGEAQARANSQAQKRRNRTNYRCSKCGQPKRGHICPYQPRIVRADGEKPPETRTVGCQVEIDSRLVVRHLDLQAQGLPESYGEIEISGQQPQQPTYANIPPSFQAAMNASLEQQQQAAQSIPAALPQPPHPPPQTAGPTPMMS